MAEDYHAKIIIDDLKHYHINSNNVERLPQASNPTSYIIHSYDTGSRSIIHFRQLPEYHFDKFQTIKLADFDWVHFEGRNVDQVYLMQQFCKTHYPELPISVEIEKQRLDIEKLVKYADVVLFSKDYAEQQGYISANSFLLKQQKKWPDKILSCAWAEQGASMIYKGELISTKAYPLKKVIDTLAAGDSYNAAIIDALIKAKEQDRHNAKSILDYACKLAGLKCAQKGIHFDKDFLSQSASQ